MQCRLEVAAELQQRWRRTNRRRKSIPRSSSSKRKGSITQSGASCGRYDQRRRRSMHSGHADVWHVCLNNLPVVVTWQAHRARLKPATFESTALKAVWFLGLAPSPSAIGGLEERCNLFQRLKPATFECTALIRRHHHQTPSDSTAEVGRSVPPFLHGSWLWPRPPADHGCATVHKSLRGHTRRSTSRDLLTSVADVAARSALRTSSSGDLVVPRTRRRIRGDTAFSVAASRAWNTLVVIIGRF